MNKMSVEEVVTTYSTNPDFEDWYEEYNSIMDANNAW